MVQKENFEKHDARAMSSLVQIRKKPSALADGVVTYTIHSSPPPYFLEISILNPCPNSSVIGSLKTPSKCA